MSDDDGSSRSAELEHDTLPMGHEVAKTPLLEMIVEAPWELVEAQSEGADEPNEAYVCDIDGAQLRLERRDRKWQGRIVPAHSDADHETLAAEDIGRVVREFQQLLKHWRKL
jgi:hypothetical protein